MAMIPAVMGDADPGLVRIPGTSLVRGYEVWLLSHPDLRAVARVHVELVARAVGGNERRCQELHAFGDGRLAGQCRSELVVA